MFIIPSIWHSGLSTLPEGKLNDLLFLSNRGLNYLYFLDPSKRNCLVHKSNLSSLPHQYQSGGRAVAHCSSLPLGSSIAWHLTKWPHDVFSSPIHSSILQRVYNCPIFQPCSKCKFSRDRVFWIAFARAWRYRPSPNLTPACVIECSESEPPIRHRGFVLDLRGVWIRFRI